METIVVLLLIIFAFFEGFVTSVPLVLLSLLTIAVQTKSSRVYVYALLAGCLLDILTGRLLGVTSLVYVVLLSTIFLYQRKYEINSHIFIFFSAMIMSLLYCLIFGVSPLFMHVMGSVLFAEALFLLWKVVFSKQNTTPHISK